MMTSYSQYQAKGLNEAEAHFKSDCDALDKQVKRYRNHEIDLIWFDAWDEPTMKRVAEYAAQNFPEIQIEFSYGAMWGRGDHELGNF